MELPFIRLKLSQVVVLFSIQFKVVSLTPEFQMFSVWFITGFAPVAVKLRFGGEKAIVGTLTVKLPVAPAALTPS